MIMGMKKVFLALGSNLGDREEYLHLAEIRIAESIGPVVKTSSIYETEPWGFKSDNKFLNKVLCVETDLSPSGLLERILIIESQLGRVRGVTHYASRNIDIDILFYENEVLNEEALKIPHPLMHERGFVIVPMAEIAPDLIHPVLKTSIQTLLKQCKDNSRVIKYEK
jgi:2-amino-4-hydroxy-6-hydroxymethyldihydropteridine diphosphokinase